MTKAFTTLAAIAAPLPIANVDTDKILAARFLKTVARAGLGEALFASMRENPEFVFNHEPWDRAGILIAGDNFGCGSSREHAPWALLDFGIRCVIAPSIADIFYNNCCKNGILPIVLPIPEVEFLTACASDAATAEMTVDLERQCIRAAGREIGFVIDPKRRHDLLNGVDEIEETLMQGPHIDAYEERARQARPWDGSLDLGALEQVAS